MVEALLNLIIAIDPATTPQSAIHFLFDRKDYLQSIIGLIIPIPFLFGLAKLVDDQFRDEFDRKKEDARKLDFKGVDGNKSLREVKDRWDNFLALERWRLKWHMLFFLLMLAVCMILHLSLMFQYDSLDVLLLVHISLIILLIMYLVSIIALAGSMYLMKSQITKMTDELNAIYREHRLVTESVDAVSC